MKITKLLFVFAIISLIAVSCKETKKEDVVDESAVEMTEEGSETSDMEATDDSSSESTDAATATNEADVAEESPKEAQEGVGAASKDVEEVAVGGVEILSEEMADTPVIYPGCAGTVEEIRACSKREFIAFLQKEFDKDLADELRLGNHEIRSVVHIDEAGKCSVLRVTAPSPQLEKEVKRVIGLLPQMTAATHKGESVSVTFILPVNFKVEQL